MIEIRFKHTAREINILVIHYIVMNDLKPM